MTTDDNDKPDNPRQANSAPVDPTGKAFRPLVVVLSDAVGEIDPAWLAQMQSTLPGRYLAASSTETAGLEVLACDPRQWPELVATAAGIDTATTHGVLIIESGLVVPGDLSDRLAVLASSPECPPLTLFAGNHDEAANPFHGLEAELSCDWCDDLAHLAGHRQWTAVDHRCRRLTFISPSAPDNIGQFAERGRGWVYDSIFVHDPRRELTAGHGRHPALATALGPLRLAGTRLNERDETGLTLPAIGRDGKAVTLHIAHHWGGGVARWIDDILAGDDHGHHLVLAARGHTDGKVHGQRLCLYAAGATRGLIGEWVLTPAIAATASAHDHYRQIVQQVIERYGIGRIIVSSLIGHSLDALQTGLPTLQVLHDYYPAWPVLEHDPLAFDSGDGIDLAGALAANGAGLLFERTDAAFWQDLAQQWLQVTAEHGVHLIAPTDQVRRRWCRLMGEELERIDIVPHGFRGWPDAPNIQSAARPDGRLNLVVVGRLTPGKGLGLLEQALPQLREIAHITLVGCGHHGMRLFGQAGVDILLDFKREALPNLIATIRPQAALFLSTVAETWNYVLSETRSLGLVPIATRTGSFIERIRDGHDGLLFEPDASPLVDCLTRLHRDQNQLAKLAENMPDETGMNEAIQACNRLTDAQPSHFPVPKTADSTAVHAMARDMELAVSTQLRLQLGRHNEALRTELAERTEWAKRYERLVKERTAWARQQEQQVVERDATILKQLDEIRHLQHREQLLQNQLDQSSQRIDALELELEQITTSRSWRLTRPLRFSVRVLRNARQRRLWRPGRWPRMISRLWQTYRAHGLRRTLDFLQQADDHGFAPPDTPLATAPRDDEPLQPVSVPSTETVRWSIVIPVHNKAEYTAACLHSILEHTPSGDWEIIVVDDCSSDQTPVYLAECQGIRVLRNDNNAGFIHSCNAGAALARGEYLVLLNNDTTVTPGWLAGLAQGFEYFDRVGVVGARLIYPDGRLQEAGGIIFSDGSGWNFGRNDDPARPEYNFACDADYVSGACLAIKAELFAKLDGFDSHYAPAYYEDTDLCFRVRESGLRVIYHPACTIVHHEGVSSGTDESSGIKRYQAINRKKFLERWSAQLRHQPAPLPGIEATELARAARHHRAKGWVLVIDAITPEPDKDSGSMRMLSILELCQEIGYRVSFMPANLSWVDGYAQNLQTRGIEFLYHPGIAGVDQWLEEHGDELDLVIISRHYILSPLLKTLRAHCPDARLAFDTVDLHFLREQREAELSGQASLVRQATKTRAAELELMRATDITLVVSPIEKELLASIVPEADVRVLSNIHTVHGRQREYGARRGLMFVGGFQHPPNIDAAEWLIEEIFPLVREAISDVQLHLIGSRMPESLKVRARACPGVVAHGFVSDLAPHLNGCRLSLAPLRYGAGVKGKVNQAMAWGLPVIATACAAEGMFLVDGEDVLIAEDAQGFAEQVIRAYRDEALWLRLSDGGLANVERYFSRNAARRMLVDLIQQPD